MAIMSWRKDLDLLTERHFLMKRKWNAEFCPIGDFCDSIYNNTEYIPQVKKEIDETDFLSAIAERYESRRREDLSASKIQEILYEYERKHRNIELVKRVKNEVTNPNHRFMLYDIAC